MAKSEMAKIRELTNANSNELSAARIELAEKRRELSLRNSEAI